MSMSGYDSAFEQATGERADIRVQIERLLTRGEQLDRLMECLAPFITNHKTQETARPQEPYVPAVHVDEHYEHQDQNEHHEYQA